MSYEPSIRFANVIACLRDLKRARPECQSEAELAIQMILGRRPNIEQKYDALLLRLDRHYMRLEDKRDHFKRIADECPLAYERGGARMKVAAINVLLNDLQWMKARNKDLIEAARNNGH